MQSPPFGVFRRHASDEAARVGVAIGDMIVDVPTALRAGLFEGLARAAAAMCEQPALNALMALGPTHWSALRLALSAILREGGRGQRFAEAILVPMEDAELLVPA